MPRQPGSAAEQAAEEVRSRRLLPLAQPVSYLGP